MQDAAAHVNEAGPAPRAGLVAAAATASIGAGIIHVAAAAVHDDAAPAMALFALVAACQIGWGVAALRSAGRRLVLAGALGNLCVLGGWAMAKVTGIGFVRGLEHAERVQLADSLAALLAALAAGWAAAALTGAARAAPRPAAGSALTTTLAAVVAAVAVAGVAAAGGHAHGDSAHGDRAHVASSDHVDAHPRRAGAERVRGRATRTSRAARPVDLGGVAGVTAAQQARAERLVAVTRRRLPRFADVAAAKARGYASIGDAVTGYEHLIKWSTINDGTILDPRRPESLVYRVTRGERKLVAAMYMLDERATLDTVPDVGGPLTQWHVHDDLCFTDSPRPVVGGITTPGGACPAPLVKRAAVPMLHVWIVPRECGPFAALEGIAGGQTKEGEAVRCHHVHGAR